MDRLKKDPTGRAPLIIGIAALLWISGASLRSLWVDEFHSLHHASQPTLAALLAGLRLDNHPPLSFLLERAAVRLLGPGDLALRLPSILIGLVYLVLLRRLSRWLPEPGAARRFFWLLLASSYCFVIFTEARMYALLALASLGVMLVLLGAVTQPPDGERRPSPWWLALWVAIGLHAHYYFVHELVIAVGFCLLAGLWVPATRRSLRTLLAPHALGVLLFLPWGSYGLTHQITGGLPPGSAAGGVRILFEGFAHFFHWNASVGGKWLVFGVALPGTLLAGVALLRGLKTLCGELQRRGDRGLVACLIMTFGLGLPVWAWSFSFLFERATFGWRYIAGAAAPVLMIAALGLEGPQRAIRLMRIGLFSTMITITLVNLLGGGQENHKRMVAFILEHAEPGDAVLAKPPYDPDPIREETSWHHYLPDPSSPRDAPLPVAYLFGLGDAGELAQAREHPRVWVWFRDSYYQWVHRDLAKQYGTEESWPMGPRLTLYRFSNPTQEP